MVASMATPSRPSSASRSRSRWIAPTPKIAKAAAPAINNAMNPATSLACPVKRTGRGTGMDSNSEGARQWF